MKNTYLRLCRVVNTLTDIVGGCLFAAMLFLSGFNVFSWWIAGRRYGQLEELILTFFVWVSYITLGQHYKRNEMIRVDFLVKLLPPKGQKVVELIDDIICLVIGVTVLYLALKLTLKSGNKLTSILDIPYSVIDSAIVVGMITLIIGIALKYLPAAKKAAAAGAGMISEAEKKEETER